MPINTTGRAVNLQTTHAEEITFTDGIYTRNGTVHGEEFKKPFLVRVGVAGVLSYRTVGGDLHQETFAAGEITLVQLDQVIEATTTASELTALF